MAEIRYTFTDDTDMPVGTMYCIGKNYAAHAREMGGEVPVSPVVFLKPPVAYLADGGVIRIPSFSHLVHHEVEMVVVIGEDCANVSRADAARYIAGYGIGLDMTLRDVQNEAKKKGEPWAIAKGFVTSAPLSAIIPASQFDGIPDFDLTLTVNDVVRQSGTTRMMERPVDLLIEYLSSVFTLRRGDCIFTGTPEGVGAVQSGDKLHAELAGTVTLDVSVV